MFYYYFMWIVYIIGGIIGIIGIVWKLAFFSLGALAFWKYLLS